MAIGKLLDALTITTELYFSFEIEFIALETLKIESLRKESLTIQNAEVQFEPIILDIGDGGKSPLNRLRYRIVCQAMRL